MPTYRAILTIVLMLGLVATRILLLKRQGVEAMQFGKIDKTDFLLPPFALFHLYLVFAHAFHWPTIATQTLFASEVTAWIGVAFCPAGLALLLWSLVSFERSFRIGIDQPPRLAHHHRGLCL